MTIIDLVLTMKEGTEFFVKAKSEDETFIFPLNNVLLGTSFATLEIWGKAKAVGRNKISFEVNVPIPILRAWAEYSKPKG